MKRKIVSIFIVTILLGNLFLSNTALAISEVMENIKQEEINENNEIKEESNNDKKDNSADVNKQEEQEEQIPEEKESIQTKIEEKIENTVVVEEKNIPEQEPKVFSMKAPTEAVIKDGIYRIAMHTNNHYGMEIANASQKVEANVQLGGWINRNNTYKKFKITYDANSGYYTIQNLNSGHVLDVQNGGMVTGTNIWQHRANGTDAQKWKIEKNEDGSYSLVSKKNGLYIDVQNGNIAEGGNLQMCMGNGTAAQKFDLICLDDKQDKTVESGIYKISLKENNNLVLQTEQASKVNGGNINIGRWRQDTTNPQRKFEIAYQEEDGYYIIKSMDSGKVLDAYNGGTTNGTNIWQYAGNDTDAQRWKIERNADGSYRFANKKSGLYLDVTGGVIQEEQNIQLYQKTDSARQKFDLIQVAEKPEKIIEDGNYRISIFENTYCYMALEIENGAKEVGANVQMGQWFNKNNEKNKFKVMYDETSGYYTIQNINSGNVLDVQNGTGPNIWQHKSNGTDAQKWRIEKNDDGSYSLVSKKNGMYLEVQNITGNANVQIAEGNNKMEQKFQFISLDNIARPVIEDGIYKIETTGNANRVIEVKDKSEDNGANIQIGNWTNTINAHQKFQFTYNTDDGYYTIQAVNSGKVWDAQNGGMTSGTNIWQYAGNDTDAQRWKIQKNKDGSYCLMNKKSGLVLNQKNNNIEIDNKQELASQKFNLVKVDKINSEELMTEGTYKIVVASRQDLAIDVDSQSREKGANIVLGKASNEVRNEFNIIADKAGYYTISSVNSGNVLDVQNGTGPNVWQHGSNGTDAQKWSIIHNLEDDTYSIVSKKNGLYIDVQNGNMAEGGNIQICVGNNTAAQKFKFIKQEDKTEKYIEDGLYKVTAKLNDSLAFDIESASKENGGIVQIWRYENVKQQQFTITYKNGYYYIVNINSNKAIQPNWGKVEQHELDYNNEFQKWVIKPANGYYVFISKASGQCIGIPRSYIEMGTDLGMEEYTNKNAQLFNIVNAGMYIDETRYPGIKQKVDELKVKHPNWNFEILYLGLNFSDAVYGEYTGHNKTNCLVDTTVYKGAWIAPDPYHSGVWYSASSEGIAYFMDPRNFLNDVDVFQFLDLNGYRAGSTTTQGIQQQLNGTFLEYYGRELNEACYSENVNPYYVIARLFQEQGRKGTTIGTGMDGGDGKTYYNPFNIGAQVGNDYATALAKAKQEGWDSMQKAIVGGIKFLKNNWLENYQNTLYQNKFDVDSRNGTALYAHEYMQNLSAAYSEARTLRNCYAEDGKVESEFTFIIPVYENMPKEASSRPSNTGSSSGTGSGSTTTTPSNSGPMDVQVFDVSSVLKIREGASVDAAILTEVTNGTKMLSIKRAINGNWHQVVTDNGIIGYASGDYLQFIADRTNCNVKKVVKTADGSGIKIRIGPSIYVDEVFPRLPDGTVVTSINTGTYYIDGYAWDRVILEGGRQVFAPAAYLK